MLYEVITDVLRLEIVVSYEVLASDGKPLKQGDVITSYSIHYTKLYDLHDHRCDPNPSYCWIQLLASPSQLVMGTTAENCQTNKRVDESGEKLHTSSSPDRS